MHITPRRHANGSAWCAPGRCRYSATRASELQREPPTGDGDHATIHIFPKIEPQYKLLYSGTVQYIHTDMHACTHTPTNAQETYKCFPPRGCPTDIKVLYTSIYP